MLEAPRRFSPKLRAEIEVEDASRIDAHRVLGSSKASWRSPTR